MTSVTILCLLCIVDRFFIFIEHLSIHINGVYSEPNESTNLYIDYLYIYN